MKSSEALQLLMNATYSVTDLGWIEHSKCVGQTAGIIASKLNLDVDKAITLGYLHDIGKRAGNFKNHDINGYEYLKKIGIDEEYCHICLTHSYLNNDVNCTAGGIPDDIPFRTNFIKNHSYTIYEKIINLCDLLCKNKRMILEQRIIEIMLRRGCHDNTVYHIREAQRLKQEIDELLGYCVYTLFDDINL